MRDRFNVPQNDVNVTANVTDGPGQITPRTQRSDVDGAATFEFVSQTSGEATIEFGFGDDVVLADNAAQNTTVNLTVREPDCPR